MEFFQESWIFGCFLIRKLPVDATEECARNEFSLTEESSREDWKDKKA